MPDRTRATDGGYFAALAPARNMRVTTFGRDGLPASASVHGMVDGDRAYFCARNRSGTVQRLRHTDALQVTPCGVLGWCTYGPPLGAVARPLSGEEASRAAAKLDRRYPVRRRLLTRLLRRQARYYELLADDAPGDQGGLDGVLSPALITKVYTSQQLMSAGAATATSLATVRTPPPRSRRLPSDYTRVIVVSMSLAAPRRAEVLSRTDPWRLFPARRHNRRGPSCLGDRDRPSEGRATDHARVRGRRKRGPGEAASSAACGQGPPGDGDDDDQGKAGLAGPVGRRGGRDGRAGRGVGRRGGGSGPAGRDRAPDDRDLDDTRGMCRNRRGFCTPPCAIDPVDCAISRARADTS